jgi:peptidoglycan/xylan/chitin deacetylase (PgdA/CDA1 family)
VTALLLVALALAASVPPGLRGKELDRLPTRKREVALTFDAGAESFGAWRLVATLRRERVPATFFLTGRWARRNPKLARVIARHFAVGNHSDTHPHLTGTSSAEVAAEIGRADVAIRRIAGRDPRPLFRFPYGDSDARTIRIANRLGYVSIRWTVDTLAWMPGQTVPGAVRRVVAALRPGAIVLMHVGVRVDVRALPRIIRALRRRGYSFVTLGLTSSEKRGSSRIGSKSLSVRASSAKDSSASRASARWASASSRLPASDSQHARL